MRIRNGLIITLLAVLMLPLLACQPSSEEEAQKFPRADDGEFHRKFSEMISYQLANGLSVYLQQDSTFDKVAIEVLYRAGFCHEPAGQVQVSHLTEHCVVASPTENFPVGGAGKKLPRGSRIAAEATGDLVHFDYVVPGENFEQALKLVSEQITSIEFDESVRQEHAKRAAGEITATLQSDRGSLTKFGMITMLHAVQHGTKFVPIYQANFDRSLEEMAAFHKQRYRPDDMVLVVVGNVDIDSTRALIDTYFSSIPAAPDPPKYKPNISGDMDVKWDIDASSVFLVYPDPLDEPRQRAALVAFGNYLSQYLARSQELPVVARATYVTNSSYPLNNLPFFVFAQPEKYRSPADIANRVSALIDEAIASVDERMFERIIGVFKAQIETSFLETEADNSDIQNHKVIGQHALNTGLRHYLRDGMSAQEYGAMLESITYEEMRQYLDRDLAASKRQTIIVTKQ
jgi:predicted Zn-dependent peptidase